MSYKRLPRSGGQSTVVVAGPLWDRVCDMVEASANLTVAYPLEMVQTPTGRVLSLAASLVIPRVTVVAASTQPGVYKGYRRRAVKQLYDQTRTGLLNADSINDFGEVPADQQEIYIQNGSEESTDTHALLASDGDASRTHVASPLEMRAKDGKLVYFINGTTAGPCVTP